MQWMFALGIDSNCQFLMQHSNTTISVVQDVGPILAAAMWKLICHMLLTESSFYYSNFLCHPLQSLINEIPVKNALTGHLFITESRASQNC